MIGLSMRRVAPSADSSFRDPANIEACLDVNFARCPPQRSWPPWSAHCCAVILTCLSYRAIWFFAFIAIFVNISTDHGEGSSEPGHLIETAGVFGATGKRAPWGMGTLTTKQRWPALMVAPRVTMRSLWS